MVWTTQLKHDKNIKKNWTYLKICWSLHSWLTLKFIQLFIEAKSSNATKKKSLSLENIKKLKSWNFIMLWIFFPMLKIFLVLLIIRELTNSNFLLTYWYKTSCEVVVQSNVNIMILQTRTTVNFYFCQLFILEVSALFDF